MAANQAKTLSDARVKAMKPGDELTDSLPGRGAGALLFKRPGEAPPSVFYRYRYDGKTKLLRIGTFKSKASVPGLGLEALRTRGRELAQILAEHGDPRLHLEELERLAEQHKAEKELERKEAERLAAVEASRGSFSDLFEDYIAGRKGKVRDDQIDEFKRILQTDLQGKHPQIMAMKARDIRPDHIRQLLEPIWNRGARRQASKVRSFLRAAFQFGMTAEHSLGRASRLSFAIESNPVDAVLVPDESTPGKRALPDGELRQFWNSIGQTEGVGFVMARLFRFVVALGGQRIEQVAREPWSSYDFEARTLRLIDAKGRGGVRREHLIPLTDRAVEILEEVRAVNGEHPWPWTSNGIQPFVTTSFAHAAADWCRSGHAVLDGKPIARFTPRDLRRSCAQLMQRAGVDDRLSDALQSHGQSGVVGTHYRNNPEAFMPQKLAAITAFEAALARVIDVIDVGGVAVHWWRAGGAFRAEVQGTFCVSADALGELHDVVRELLNLNS